MSPNILVTGAAGYIGGSIVTDFLARNDGMFKKEQIIAAVRSKEQVDVLSKQDIQVIKLDLSDEESVIETVLQRDVGIVIHLASSLNKALAMNLITALAKHQEATGEQTTFIHTSGLSAFTASTGWPAEEASDMGPIFDTEKSLADSFAIRETDVTVIEYAKERGVTSFIVVPTIVYGRGTGQWNKVSVSIPVVIQASIGEKQVYKFPEDKTKSGVHISDITALYGLIVKKVIQKETIPNGEEGYYFAIAHNVPWYTWLDRLASALKARGITETSDVKTWPNDEFAAKALGVPAIFVKLLWNSADSMTVKRPFQIGWKPVWDEEKFLGNVDEEVRDMLELGRAKSSLMDVLRGAAAAAEGK